MAITRTQLAAATVNTPNGVSFTTASISPVADSLILVLVRNHHATAGSPTCAVTADAGLTLLTTFSEIVRASFNTIASPTDQVIILGALAGSTPGSGTITITYSGTGSTQSGDIWEVVSLSGVNTTGGTVASCIQQSQSNQNDTAGTAVDLTYSSAPAAGNASYIANGNASTLTGWTPDAAYTEATDQESLEGVAYNLETLYVLSGAPTGETSTAPGSAAWGAVGVEVKATAAVQAPMFH